MCVQHGDRMVAIMHLHSFQTMLQPDDDNSMRSGCAVHNDPFTTTRQWSAQLATSQRLITPAIAGMALHWPQGSAAFHILQVPCKQPMLWALLLRGMLPGHAAACCRAHAAVEQLHRAASAMHLASRGTMLQLLVLVSLAARSWLYSLHSHGQSHAVLSMLHSTH